MTFPRQSVATLMIRDPFRFLRVLHDPSAARQSEGRYTDRRGVANLLDRQFLMVGVFFSLSARRVREQNRWLSCVTYMWR